MRHFAVLMIATILLTIGLSSIYAQTPPRILVQKLESEDGDIMDIVTNTGNTHCQDYILTALHVETGAEISTSTGDTPVENLRINQVDAGFVAAIVNQSAFPSVWPAGNTVRLTITYIPTDEVATKDITVPEGTSSIILTDPEDVMIVPPYEGTVSPNPAVAINPIPENGATDISIDLSEIGWSYISNPGFTDPVGFRIYMNTSGVFDPEDPFEWIAYIPGQEDYLNSDILPAQLIFETTYYWKVVPTTIEPTRNRIYRSGTRGDAINVPIWSFTIEEEPFIPFAGGTGTVDDPYLVETADQLNYVRDFLPYHFRQISNINLGTDPWNTGNGWQPIGSSNDRFTGSYDGDNYTISGLTIARPTGTYQGLFAETENALLENIILENVDIAGQNRTGGIVGQNRSSIIQHCLVDGTISGSWFVGGITGYNLEDSTISECQNLAEVTGTQSVGGIVGYQSNSMASNSSSSGSVSNSGNYTGGLVGYNNNQSTVFQCFATSDVSGTSNIGGLVGYNAGNSSISQCFASGSVNSTGNFVGGLVGYHANSEVDNSYATGSSTGNSNIGGLTGYNSSATLSNSYSIGVVNGSSNLGGLVGAQYDSVVNNSYWNTETSGQESSAGGEGHTTAEMLQIATYIGWDFDEVWAIFENETYAILQWSLGTYLFPVTDLSGEFIDEEVILSWSEPYSPAGSELRLELQGYNVYRNQEQLNTELLTETVYHDPDVEYGITYTYYVTVVYDEGESGQSNSFTITPEPPYLYPPENLMAETGNEFVFLTWDSPNIPENSSGLSHNSVYHTQSPRTLERLELLGYNIYRNGAVINTAIVTDNEYEDYNVINGLIYSYYVTAVYVEGESEASNEIEAIPEEPEIYPPLNLTYFVEDNDVTLEWSSPFDTVELVYDNNDVTDFYSYNGYTMGVQMSPDQPCLIVSLKYYTSLTGGSGNFNVEIYDWSGSQPGTNLMFSDTCGALNNQWTVIDVSDQNLFVDEDFVVGFGSINVTTLLGYDASYDNGRSWDLNHANSTWSQWNETYLIRAVVLYQDGTIATISPSSNEEHNNSPIRSVEKLSFVKDDPLTINRENARELEIVGYNVYRDNMLINDEPIEITTFTETNLPAGTYHYYVTALYSDTNYEGESEPSNSVEVTILRVDSMDETPSVTELISNYPNPFNPDTTIQFNLANADFVTIDVFNVRGQKVVTLIDDYLESGKHSVVWNGRDYTNNQVSSGVYFYRMSSKDYSSIKKMIMMK